MLPPQMMKKRGAQKRPTQTTRKSGINRVAKRRRKEKSGEKRTFSGSRLVQFSRLKHTLFIYSLVT